MGTATVIQGNGGSSSRFSRFSMRMVCPVVYAGTVTALGAGTLSDASADWTEGQFNGTNGSCYVEFESGVMADINRTDASTQTLSVPASLPASVSVGDVFRIRRHETLSEIFGASNQAGLLAGPNSSQADNVLLHIPQTQQTLTFFYSNVPGYNGWYRSDYTPAGDTVIYPEQGLIVNRKSTTNVVLYLNGPTKEGVTVAPVFTGFNLVGTLKSRKSLKLSELNLYTGNPDTGIAAAANSTAADNLLVVNPDNTTTTYFYSDYPGFEGWYDVSYKPSGDVIIAAGTAFYIQRKAPRALFYWSIPAE